MFFFFYAQKRIVYGYFEPRYTSSHAGSSDYKDYGVNSSLI